jgi:hypothetical protein
MLKLVGVILVLVILAAPLAAGAQSGNGKIAADRAYARQLARRGSEGTPS